MQKSALTLLLIWIHVALFFYWIKYRSRT